MMGLTPRESECLAAIKRLTVDGVPPTYEQIGQELGLASKSGVHRMVRALEERGHLRRRRGPARSIAVIPSAADRARTASLHNMSTADLRAHVEEGLAILRERES